MAKASSEWSRHALAALREAGYRGGGARTAVVELLGRQECCLTAHEIFDRLRRGRRPVGIASVYRVLDLLAELKLVKRVDVGGGTARYEAAHPTGEHHHHLVCDDCGRVEAFGDERLESTLGAIAGRLDYDVGGHEVLLHGACGDCRPARHPTGAAVGGS